MRSLSTNLKNHLAEETTTLATCLKMVRRDGKEYTLTDHDKSLTIGLDTYTPSSSYNRTAIESDNTFKIDNIDLSGFFATGFLEEAEFRAGLFDFSEIEIFIVNYNSTADGKMILKKGFLGELRVEDNGVYSLEMRGLKQSMAQLVGAKYQAECRAALGDSKCKFPIDPPFIVRDKAYSIGDFVKVQLANLGATDYAVPITNPDFESSLNGWTTLDGSWAASGSQAYSGAASLLPNQTTAFSSIYQDIDLSTEPSFSTASADAGYLAFYGTYMRYSSDNSELDAGMRVTIKALDSNSEVIKTVYKSRYERADEDSYDTWEFKTIDHELLPANTRHLRILIEFINDTGSSVTEFLDDILFRIIDLGGTTGLQEMFSSRIYECTVAGTTASATPSYNSTIDSDTTDGTATFTARQAFTIHAEVAGVTDNQTFTLTLTDSRAVDDWFNYGALTFEDGSNAGITMEVKDWDRTGGDEVTLFLPMPYSVTVGDKCKIYSGCDKKLATCLARFAIANSTNFPTTLGNTYNFRGEPYIPGREFLTIGGSTTSTTYSRQGGK